MFHLYNTIFFMLVFFNEGCCNHVVYTYVVKFIISIEPRCIFTSILQVCIKLINKKVSNVCLFYQRYILINSRTFEGVLFIIKWYQNAAEGYYWDRLGVMGKIHIILFFSHIKVRVEVNPWLHFILQIPGEGVLPVAGWLFLLLHL